MHNSCISKQVVPWATELMKSAFLEICVLHSVQACPMITLLSSDNIPWALSLTVIFLVPRVFFFPLLVADNASIRLTSAKSWGKSSVWCVEQASWMEGLFTLEAVFWWRCWRFSSLTHPQFSCVWESCVCALFLFYIWFSWVQMWLRGVEARVKERRPDLLTVWRCTHLF